MIYPDPRIGPNGDRSIRIAFGDERSLAVNRPVRAMERKLREIPVTGVTELLPTYAALAVMYDPARVRYASLAAQLAVVAREALSAGHGSLSSRLLRVPVCYEGEMAPDMDLICHHGGLSPGEVVRIHTAEPYHVFQIGFTPGCPFLGPLQTALHIPLMETPRTHTPTGAVAISVGQTVIYPRATPGGMRIVGRTPVRLFQVDHPELTLFKPGDRVQFVSVTEREFHRVATRARQLGEGVEMQPGG